MEYLIYKSYYNNVCDSTKEIDIDFKIWKPSIFNPIPLGLPKKYLLYYFFYLFQIFKNKNYYAILGYKNNVIACSLLIVPSYFKWPFMQKNDVQLIYVKTYSNFRGNGYAKKMVFYSLNFLKTKSEINDIWYVTDSNNLASQALAKGTFFKNDFVGKRIYLYGIKWMKGLTTK